MTKLPWTQTLGGINKRTVKNQTMPSKAREFVELEVVLENGNLSFLLENLCNLGLFGPIV